MSYWNGNNRLISESLQENLQLNWISHFFLRSFLSPQNSLPFALHRLVIMFNDRVKNCEVSITVILESIIVRLRMFRSMQKELKENDHSQRKLEQCLMSFINKKLLNDYKRRWCLMSDEHYWTWQRQLFLKASFVCTFDLKFHWLSLSINPSITTSN